jgi:hypothetical protein
MAPEYLNVDLDIVSRSRLDALVAYFEASGALVLAHERLGPRNHVARIEVEAASDTPAPQLSRLCRLLESMPPELRLRLARCSLTMDVGVAGGTEYPARRFSVPPPLLTRLLAQKVTLAFTFYPFSAERDF